MSENPSDQTEPAGPKAPSAFTEAVNAAVQLSFDDPGDTDRATRGLIAQIDDGRVTMRFPGAEGQPAIEHPVEHTVWDVARHAFVTESEQPPSSVNPSLWRQARLNKHHGLFEVADGVWQVRGYDIANITFLAGDDGWLIIDPLTNAPAAAAALDLTNRTLGERPVTSVIYTHSHTDHYGGILGVTSQEAVDRGDVRIVAPEGFMKEVVSENVIAGPIMLRRAAYQFGPLLPPGPRGHVDCGLGSALGLARSDLIAPTEEVSETGTELVLDGIRVVFQNTPEAEAPAEMNFFFPELGGPAGSGRGLLCMAENCTHTLHNTYPIRGAQIRDALAWSKYIHEALVLWGDHTETMFASHHWPRFGPNDVRGFLEMQRDAYRWMHDQTMRLANRGHVPTEIAAELRLPAAFDQSHVQGYYGTVSHNVRSVYHRYLGWYDGNPANLDPFPPVDAGQRYVEAMGGADAVLDRAQASFDEGDYRWVVQLVNHVVFADPSNQRARHLQADAMEQLGYQAESATWRNAYLMGAQELRHGSPIAVRIPERDMSNAMQAEHLVDLIGVRFDPAAFETASGRDRATINLHLTDLGPAGEDHVLGIARSTIHHTADARADDADVSVRLTRAQLAAALGQPEALAAEVEVRGDRQVLIDLLASLDVFEMQALIEP